MVRNRNFISQLVSLLLSGSFRSLRWTGQLDVRTLCVEQWCVRMADHVSAESIDVDK